MAEPLPQALKIPEVSRFINRANQLRSVKPAISYWCEYHAVNQIVGKNLHTTDDDCFNFTKTLLERLETTKAERADDDAIVDNTAGQAYVEQFAQETFDRAERTLRANKVSRQTADTFDAAATFFDLTHEWGTPDAETIQKIKFAKWNAARILKAIREGKDPNESNPKPREPEPELDIAMALDPNDPDVRQITSPSPQIVSVEDIPDAGEPQRDTTTGSLAGFQPSPSLAANEGYFPQQPATTPSEPFVPSPLSVSPVPGPPSMLPPAQPTPPAQAPIASIPPQPSPQVPTNMAPELIQTSTPQPQFPPPMAGSNASQWTPTNTAPSQPTTYLPPIIPSPGPIAPSFQQPPVPQATSVAPVQHTTNNRLVNDQKSINQAQKHAKWAISALNFEDVPTAVQELRNALAMLGAQ